MNNELADEISTLLDKYDAGADSKTPTWALAEYLLRCLDAWNAGVKVRDCATRGGRAGQGA